MAATKVIAVLLCLGSISSLPVKAFSQPYPSSAKLGASDIYTSLSSSCFASLDVSSDCGLGLITLLSKKDKIKSAYEFYALANKDCLANQIHNGECWDKRLDRLGQGTCDVENCTLEESLIQVASNVSRLCNGTATIGTDGAVVSLLVPLPIPYACRNPDDLTAIHKCAVNQTCGNLSSTVVPVCELDLGCDGIPHDETYKTDFAAVVSAMFGAVVLLSLLAVIGTRLSRAKAKRGLSRTASDYIQMDVESGGQDRKFTLNSVLKDHIDYTLSAAGEDQSRDDTLIWRSLFFRQKGTLVLRGMSGYLTTGSCVAVIGAPDSGATTLLKVLAGRASGKMSGEVLLNSKPPDKKLGRIVGYIPKEDTFLPELTVRETLQFAFAMRAPVNVPISRKDERIQLVLDLLGLSHVANTIIGDSTMRGISGGEKRRVSLGVEGVVGRSLLLADSPTNGLDSVAAYNMIKASRALADARVSGFMASMRQAGPELLHLFDTVCLVSRGRCMYFGPMESALPYLTAQGFDRPIGKSEFDFMEELTGDSSKFWRRRAASPVTATSDGVPDGFEVTDEIIVGESSHHAPPQLTRSTSNLDSQLVKNFEDSDLHKTLRFKMFEELDNAVRREIEREEHEAAMIDGECHVHRTRWFDVLINDDGNLRCFSERYATGFFFQVALIIVRQVKLIFRSPTIKARIFRAVFQSVLFGTMFYQLGSEQRDLNNRFSLMFTGITSAAMGTLASIPEIYKHRQVFYSQKAAGYFRPWAYHAALFFTELPISGLEMFIYASILYKLCGLSMGVVSFKFLYFWLDIWSVNMIAWSFNLVGTYISPSDIVATAFCPSVMALFLLFSGFLIPKSGMPSGLRWLYDASFITRAYEGAVINELSGETYHCTPDELIPKNESRYWVPPPKGYWSEAYRACPFTTGDLALQVHGYTDASTVDKWSLLADSMYFLLGFNVILFFVMTFVSYDTDTSDSAVKEAAHRKKLEAAERTGQEDAYTELPTSDEAASPVDSVGWMEFIDLNYTVETSPSVLPNFSSEFRQPRQLLTDVSGFVKPGTVVALMGPSGAGKSTLLDVLAEKKTGGKIEHERLLVNGKPINAYYSRIAGYVEQTDSHLPTATVRESIEMSAALRLDHGMSAAQKKRRVDEVIAALNLGAFENAYTADVSPEVKKKTTIGVEIVSNPSILFLDEPTTGLDSSSAVSVMESVRKTCAGKAVICTIHQPSREVFELFDWMLLLQRGGRVCYFGPAEKMNEYFESEGFGRCPEGKNPADFALDCAQPTPNRNPADVYDASDWKKSVLKGCPSDPENGAPVSELNFSSPYAAPFRTQFKECLKTQAKYIYRDTPVIATRVITAAGFGALVGLLFFQMDTDQVGAQSRIGLIFITIVYCGYSGMLSIPKNIDQRPVVFRERGSKMYSVLPFYLANVIADMPMLIIQTLCYCLPAYFMSGMRLGKAHFFLFVLCVGTLNFCMFAFSDLIGAMSPNSDVGTIINTIVNSVFTLFCGFLLPYPSIPSFWRFMYYLSIFRYALGFLCSNELNGLSFTCTQNTSFPVFVGGDSALAPSIYGGKGNISAHCSPVSSLPSKINDPLCFQHYCLVTDGSELLEKYAFPTSTGEMFTNLVVLCCFFGLFRVLAFFALKHVQHIQR